MTLPSDDQQRLDALKRYFVLDAPVEDAGVRITRVAAALYGVPYALLLVRDGDAETPVAAYGVDLAELPEDAVYCARTTGPALPIIVADAASDPRFADHPLVHGPQAVRFIASVPLKSRHGFTVGTLAIMDREAQELNGEGLAMLVDFAGAAEPEFELHRAYQERDTAEAARAVAEAERDARAPGAPDDDPFAARYAALEAHVTALEEHAQTLEVHARTAEHARAEAETARAHAEAARLEAEAERAHADALRAEAEALRAEADARRADAEAHLGEASASWQSERAAWDAEHERLAASKAEAEHTARLETLFLAGVSHQVRSALTSILGYAEVLAEEVGEDGKAMAETILASGQRLEQILRTALDLARMESDGAAPLLDAVDVRTLVEAAAHAFAPVAAKRDIALYVEGLPEPGTPAPRAWGDPGGLARVLDHLLQNAFRFTAQGGIRLRVSAPDPATLGRNGAGWVCLEVQDTGIGIEEAHLPHLFDESRLERSMPLPDDGVEHGVGLGLAITKRLVELMGGEISAQSVKGQGSVFRVLLQAAPPAAPLALDPSEEASFEDAPAELDPEEPEREPEAFAGDGYTEGSNADLVEARADEE